MKKRTLSLALAMALLLTACAGSGATALTPTQPRPPVTAAVDEDLDAALGDFGLELLRRTRKEGENTFLSPLGAALCLSMAANGAAGETLEQFQAVLAGGRGLDALNGNCRSLLERYAALEGAGGEDSAAELYGIVPGASKLSIANSLWLDGRVRAQDGFLGLCAGTYDAGTFAADFTADATRREINAWIKKHTGGHIEDALARIDPETVLAMVNAVYFQGKWENEFDPEDTRKGRPFYPEDGGEAQVDMMSNGGRRELYIGTEAEQGVLLPYKDGALAFLALLPEEGTALGDYLDGLDGASLAELIAGAEQAYFQLYIPKFETMWRGSLADALQDMGLTDAFLPGVADFSAMGTDEEGMPLFLNAVEHGAGIEVDEQGTRAFSFTFMGMGAGSAAPPTQLVFDRPFVYAVVDMGRGVPLFLGTFERP